MFSRAQEMVAAFRKRAAAFVGAERDRYLWFDHVAGAYERYKEQRGDRRAASVAYYGFLSFFPLVALALSLIGIFGRWAPGLHDDVINLLQENFPGLVGPGKINPDQIGAATTTGLLAFGTIGLLYAGLGWISALRAAIRAMWAKDDEHAPNLIVAKAKDVEVLALLGGVMLLTVVFTAAVDQVGTRLANHFGIQGTNQIGFRIAAQILALVSDLVLFVVMFWKLSGVTIRPLKLWRGALIASIGYEVLKLLAARLLAHALGNPVYASLAIAAGLMIWINLTTRVTLYAAAWTAMDRRLRLAT